MVHTSNKGFLQVPNDLVDTKSKLHASWHKSFVLVIINGMISNDWKIGIMEESKKSLNKYCLIVKNREILKEVGVHFSLIIINWKPYATNNNKKSSS